MPKKLVKDKPGKPPKSEPPPSEPPPAEEEPVADVLPAYDKAVQRASETVNLDAASKMGGKGRKRR